MTDLELLPGTIDEAEFWRAVHRQPLDAWRPALEHIREHHRLPRGAWSRFRLGKNVVVGGPDVVVKLAPPFWAADLLAEAETLRFVEGRLPLATPAVAAQGTIGTWAYLVQQRLPGEPLRFRWPGLDSHERAALAYQQGGVMAALHALPTAAAPPQLSFDWTAMLNEQRADCRRALLEVGVPTALVSDVDAYLDPVWTTLIDNSQRVLLHGDLDAINLLVVHQADGLQLSGLVDWGDAKLGPSMHEYISPGVHSFIGDGPALEAWYRGYGLDPEHGALIEHDVMARSILYYADELYRYLERVPGALACRRWADVARLLWKVSG